MAELRRPSRMEGMAVERGASIRDQVAGAIRDAITDLRFRPGEVLIERELCDATGASRATVREALRRLESEGLVISAPGHGTRVAGIGRQEAIDLYEVRAVLEGMAGYLFAHRASEERQRALGDAVRRIATQADDAMAMLRAKREFYDVLFEGASNAELCKMLDVLHRRVSLLRAASLSVPGRARQSVIELSEIAAAASVHDAERTAHLCIEHVYAAARAGLGSIAEMASENGDAGDFGHGGNGADVDKGLAFAQRFITTAMTRAADGLSTGSAMPPVTRPR